MKNIHTDVAVVGGGIAGVSAAIAIAQEKKKVVLIDRLPVIGGASVNSNVGTVCGAFYRSYSVQKIAGNSFSNFFMDILRKFPGISKPYHHQDGLYIIPYEWTALRNIYIQLLAEFSVDVLLSSTLTSTVIANSSITELIANEETSIKPNTVVDCSGNAIVSQLAGLEIISDPSYQAASQIFRVKKVSQSSEYGLNMALKKAVLKQEFRKNWPPSHRSLAVVQGSIRNNSADLKITLPEIISDKTDLEVLKKKAVSLIDDLFPILKKEIKSLEWAEIETIFPLPGYRVMQRSKGKYILEEEDVLNCKKPDQGIAVGTWPVEVWDYEGKLNMEFFAPDDGYHIPADCLTSDKIENLFFGGRNISATSKALASARVMGTCWQTGYAAGKLSCARIGPETELAIEKLHAELR